MTHPLTSVAFTLLFACQPKGDPDPGTDGGGTDGGGVPNNDQDGDGYINWEAGGDDCDDLDPIINPGAAEIWYDGVNQDCSWGSDYDADGDQDDHVDFGGGDCDDTDFWIGSTALELCSDLIDNDCDGLVDEAPCGRTVGEADGAWLGTEHRYLGYAMETNCDVDGDGELEVLVTGPRAATADMAKGPQEVAGVHMLSRGDELDPTDGLVVRRERTKVAFGTGLDCHGDLDGDGYLDLAVTSFDEGDMNTGVAYVFRGPLSGEIDAASADLTIVGEWISSFEVERIGAMVLVADLTGDGETDVLVGDSSAQRYWNEEHSPTGTGNPRLFRNIAAAGEVVGWDDSIEIESRWGGGLDSADIDGDGIPDLLVDLSDDDTWPDRCAGVYSGSDLAGISPGGSMEADDLQHVLNCIGDEDRLIIAGVPYAFDLDDDGHQDVTVLSYGGTFSFQGGATLGRELSPAAWVVEDFCNDFTSGFADVAFDRNSDGALTMALSLGSAAGLPSHRGQQQPW